MTKEQPTLNDAILTYSADVDKILPALVQAKQAFSPVLKEQKNNFYNSNFANSSMVTNAITPALLENGLIFMQPKTIIETDGKIFVGIKTVIWHESGQFISSEAKIPFLPQKQPKNTEKEKGADLHSIASLMTYCSRYFLLGIFGLAADDDDGNAHVKMQQQPPPPPMPTQAQIAKLKFDLASMDNGTVKKFDLWLKGLGCPNADSLMLSDFGVARDLLDKKIAKIKADAIPVPKADAVAIKNAATGKSVDEAECVKWVNENTRQKISALTEINSEAFVQLGAWIQELPIPSHASD